MLNVHIYHMQFPCQSFIALSKIILSAINNNNILRLEKNETNFRSNE